MSYRGEYISVDPNSDDYVIDLSVEEFMELSTRLDYSLTLRQAKRLRDELDDAIKEVEERIKDA